MTGGVLQYLVKILSGFPFYFFGILLLADTNYSCSLSKWKIEWNVLALSNISLGDAHTRPTNLKSHCLSLQLYLNTFKWHGSVLRNYCLLLWEKKSNQITYLISRTRFHIMHTILTANLSNSVVISACHYMKEKIKTFQVLLHLNASYSVKTTGSPTSVCVCVRGRKRRSYVKPKTLGSIYWFYLGYLVEMQRNLYVPELSY